MPVGAFAPGTTAHEKSFSKVPSRETRTRSTDALTAVRESAPAPVRTVTPCGSTVNAAACVGVFRVTTLSATACGARCAHPVKPAKATPSPSHLAFMIGLP